MSELERNFKLQIIIVFICLEVCFCLQKWNETKAEYLRRRTDFLEDERSFRTGYNISLTPDEMKANGFLKDLKNDEIERARQGSTKFPPALHFFEAKPLIDQSLVFQILRTMPKGAVLHIHDSAMVDARWLIEKATYLDECYMCYVNHSQLNFHFFPKQPKKTADCSWENVNHLRSIASSVSEFDQWLYNNMTLVVRDPHQAYPTQDAVWGRFQSIFQAISGLAFYAPVFRAYFRQALQTFYDDNVLYLEVRALLPPVYELDGTVHDRLWTLKTYREISQQFQKEHRDFMGVKVIYTTTRTSNQSVVAVAVMEAMLMRTMFPDFMVGYDLVGREDTGHPLRYYLDQLLLPSQQTLPFKLPYFFHAGETDWNEENVDDDLIDALLLNTSRIGHGYGLTKHPKALAEVKRRGVAVELNPISNQVLGLVDDLRNHPGADLLAQSVPLVVSCDDPGLWGATGVSYDWYETFMGVAGAKDDLRLLKKLAMDSIKYSAMTDSEKVKAMAIWQEKWKLFIHRANEKFSNKSKRRNYVIQKLMILKNLIERKEG